MQRRLEDSWIEECSLALGRRKATFTGPGPQPTMLPWFQRSTHVRSICGRDERCPSADASESNAPSRQKPLRHAAVRREVAVGAVTAASTVRLLIVDSFPDCRLQ